MWAIYPARKKNSEILELGRDVIFSEKMPRMKAIEATSTILKGVNSLVLFSNLSFYSIRIHRFTVYLTEKHNHKRNIYLQ
jgi:hypothetical protein